MLSEDAKLGCLFAFIAAAVIGTVLSAWVISSHYEAKAFNRVTGKNVATWDAMWIELRVQEGSQQD